MLEMSAVVQAACPASCQCRNNRAGKPIFIDCRNRNLREVIADIPPDVIELDLSDNPITNLTRSSFPSLPALSRLSIENCFIERLERMTFRNLGLLEILELSRNRIRSIDESAFTGLSNLRELRISDNQLETIPGHSFRALSLDVLDLSGNRLTEIRDGTFEAASVDSLNLDRNRFVGLYSGSFRSLSNSLTKLTVNHNADKLSFASDTFTSLKLTLLSAAFSGISDVSFLGQISAKAVDLSGNEFGAARFPRSVRLTESCLVMKLRSSQLNKISDNLAYSLGVVQSLDLSNNTITAVDGGLFRWMPKLSTLDLSINLISKLNDNFAANLGSLKNLNLSRSGLKSFGASGTPFTGANSLVSLDISHNHFQVFPELSFKPVLESVQHVNLSGNHLHCNCEAAWLQSWLSRATKNIGTIKCFDQKSGQADDILSRRSSDFICSGPRILDITQNLNLDDGEDAMLSCTAQSDPAAEIVWKSPFGEVFSITPPNDRKITGTYAAWQISRIKPDQAGWYVCSAENIQASVVQYTYVNVVTDTLPPLDLRDLRYPNIPSELMVLTPPVWSNDEKSPGRSTDAYNRIGTSADGQRKFAEKTALDNSEFTKAASLEAQLQSSEGLQGDLIATPSAQDKEQTGRNAIIIAGVVVPAVILMSGVIFCLVVKRQRSRRRRGHYPVKDKYDEEVNNAKLPDIILSKPERIPLHDRTNNNC